MYCHLFGFFFSNKNLNMCEYFNYLHTHTRARVCVVKLLPEKYFRVSFNFEIKLRYLILFLLLFLSFFFIFFFKTNNVS